MTYPSGPTAWSAPPASAPPRAAAPVPTGSYPVVQPGDVNANQQMSPAGGGGQVYSSAYVQDTPAPYQPGVPAGPHEYSPEYQASGYDEQAYAPQPYQAGQAEEPSLFGLHFESQQQAYGYEPDQNYHDQYSQQAYADPYGAQYHDQQYDAQPPAPAEKPKPETLLERIAAVPKTALLGAVCVALLLAATILLTMYIKQSGKTDDAAGELKTAQQNVKQRDDKIKQLDSQVADAEKKAGDGTDQLSAAQTELQKAKQDLDTATKDKTSLTTCLQALTKASAETDPVKQQQLAQQSKQTCAKGFELAGIQAQ